MNYIELRQTLADYAHRDDLTDQIKRAVNLAETRIYSDVKAPENEYWKSVTLTESPFALPYEWISPREVTVGGVNGKRYPLQYLPPEQFYRYTGQAVSTPTVYTINQRAMSILRAPTVESPVDAQLAYWGRLNPLTNDSDTNAMLESYPGLFIYAGMLEIAPFTLDAESLMAWREMYTAEVTRINGASEESRHGVSMAMRIG